MVERGVKIVYCPSWWGAKDTKIALKHNPKSEEHLVNTLCKARALENGIIFVYCNSAGEITVGSYQNELIGCSQITIPFKGVQKRLNHNKEEMFIEEINTKINEDHEKGYKIKSDLKNRI